MKDRLLIIVVFIVVNSIILVSECNGFEIIKPESGSIFHPGDDVTVEVSIDQDEQLKGVWFYTLNIRETGFDFTKPYTFEFTIPLEYAGSETIVANGKLQDDSHVESSVEINVVLPSSIVLNKIILNDKYIILIKVPAGTKGANFLEQEQIIVKGMFSDGVTRNLSAPSIGTTYESTNKNIATVNSEGLVNAVAPGNAQIIIKNGNLQETVSVLVEAEK